MAPLVRARAILDVPPDGLGLRGSAARTRADGSTAPVELRVGIEGRALRVLGLDEGPGALLLDPGTAASAIRGGDAVMVARDAAGRTALAVTRGSDLMFAFGDIANFEEALDLGAASSGGFTRVDLRVGTALARRELIASRDELAFWLGHFVGSRALSTLR